MAEAIANKIGHTSASAGTHPGIQVARFAIQVLSEIDISINDQKPKSIDNIDVSSFDKIISMGCGVECPDININLDWKLEDPLGKNIEFYRDTRDKILKYILQLEQLHTDV